MQHDPDQMPDRGRLDPFRPLDGDDDEFGYDLYDDYEEGAGDRGLLRVVGVIAVLGLLAVGLLVWPFSLLGGGGAEEEAAPAITTSARGDLPALPDGLAARSALYDITTDGGFAGPAALTVRLGDAAAEGERLGFYTHEGGAWTRLGPVAIVDGGRFAQAQVDRVPANIAVLARTEFARSLALIVEPGEAPDAAALGAAGIVSVRAARPTAGDAIGQVDVIPGALTVARGAAGGADVYLGVHAPSAADAAAVDAILTLPSIAAAHADALIAAAGAALGQRAARRVHDARLGAPPSVQRLRRHARRARRRARPRPRRDGADAVGRELRRVRLDRAHRLRRPVAAAAGEPGPLPRAGRGRAHRAAGRRRRPRSRSRSCSTACRASARPRACARSRCATRWLQRASCRAARTRRSGRARPSPSPPSTSTATPATAASTGTARRAP